MSSFGYQPNPTEPKDIGEYREHRRQVLSAARELAFKGQSHLKITSKKKKKAKRRKQPKVVPRTQEWAMGIHQSALANKVRDTNIAENIKVRLKEDDTLTERQTTELMNIRRELIK